jgi:hypothetical protein
MEMTHGSETSAQHILTPGKYPKEHLQYSNHGESLKSTKIQLSGFFCISGCFNIPINPDKWTSNINAVDKAHKNLAGKTQIF